MTVETLLQTEVPPAETYLEPFTKALLGFVVVYVVGHVVVAPTTGRVIRARNPRNPTLHQAVERYVEAAVLVVALLVAVTLAGYGPELTRSSLIIAAATLAVGVAGQEVIGNLVSGLFLVTDPNFNVGDWIAWNDSEGVVESVALRVTRVRTPSNEEMTVPNTELTTHPITRPYGREEFRVEEQVGIDYDDDVDAARTILEEAAETDAILSDPSPRAYFSGFGDDAVELVVHYWIRNPTRQKVMRVRSAYAERAKERFGAAGLSLSPAPGRDLSGEMTVTKPGGDERA